MTKVHRFVFVTLLALLVASASARAQSGGAASSGKPSSGAALQEAQPAVVTTAKKSGNKRSMIAGASAQGGLRLCFQPGVGWQRVPLSAVGGARDTSESGSSGGTGVKESTLSGTAKSAYAQPSGASQATNTECPGSSPSAAASGTSVDSHAQSMTSIDSTGMNKGAQGRLGANSAINPASTGSPLSGTMGRTSMTARGESAFGASTNGVKNQAYTSSIELRRMIRSAPDLQTRMRLQRLQDNLAQKSRASISNLTGHQGAKEQLKNRHQNKAYSSSGRGGHDNVNDGTKLSSSRTYQRKIH